MPYTLLIKENIPKPLINQTNNACHNDDSFTQMEYTNTGLDRWASSNYIMDYIGLQNNIDLGTNTLNNNCQNIKVNSLKKLPPEFNTQNMQSANIKLSDDNIKLMSGCEFSNNMNPITGKPCFEAMQNLSTPQDLNEKGNLDYSPYNYNTKMDFTEKGYLIAFTILTVGLLYKANYKINL
jgi:hypothetical protein